MTLDFCRLIGFDIEHFQDQLLSKADFLPHFLSCLALELAGLSLKIKVDAQEKMLPTVHLVRLNQ